MGYFAKASAPDNFILPRPTVRTPTNREDLHSLVNKLDDKEVDIVIGYVANLLLESAKVSESKLKRPYLGV